MSTRPGTLSQSLLGLFLALWAVNPVYASTWTVCSSGCDLTSIQEAVDLSASGDTIQLGAQTYFENVCVARHSGAGPHFLTIRGVGREATVVDGSGISQPVFTVLGRSCVVRGPSISLTLVDMTVQDSAKCGIEVAGDCNIFGCHFGDVTVQNCAIRNNNCGLVLEQDSTVSITNTTITGNDGHGLHNASSVFGGAAVHSSSISGNGGDGIHVADFFGVRVIGGTWVANSTVSGNGAGIVLSSRLETTVTISQSTIADNAGPGLLNNTFYSGSYLGSFEVSGSIVADNQQDNCWTHSGGHNLSDAACLTAAPSDILGTDPQLLPLADNGGPTATHALALSSPAIDAGGNDCGATDQRGTTRPLDGDGDGVATCDIGAYELVRPDPLDLLNELVEDVASLGLPPGIENSLLVKLNAATSILGDPQPNNDHAAVNHLEAFVRRVAAQYGTIIAASDADALIEAAEEIIELLSTTPGLMRPGMRSRSFPRGRRLGSSPQEPE